MTFRKKGTPPYTEDVLMGIGTYLPRGRKCFATGRVPEDKQRIEDFFYEQKRIHPELLQRMGFGRPNLGAYSEDLAQAIMNLTPNFIVTASNCPWLRHFSKRGILYFRNDIKETLTPEQDSELQALTKVFDEKVAVREVISC